MTQLDEAIKAIEAGEKQKGRRLLVSFLSENPDDADAWLRLASVTEDDARRRQAFERVVELDPENDQARHYLEDLDKAKSAKPLTQTCPHCYSEIDARATVCPKCQRDIIPPKKAGPDGSSRRVVVAVIAVIALAAVLLIVAAVFLRDRGNNSAGAPEAPDVLGCQASSYSADVLDLSDRWDDANALARSTSRIALSGPLGELQSIRRDASRLTPPSCAQEAHRLLLSYMDATIEGYLAFMGDSDDSIVETRFETASNYFDRWSTAFAKLDN